MKLSKFQQKVTDHTKQQVEEQLMYYDKLLLRLSSVAGCLAAYDMAQRTLFRDCDECTIEAELGEALSVIAQIAVIWGLNLDTIAKEVIDTDFS